MNHLLQIRTLGELKKSGYQPRSVKDELRQNLIENSETKRRFFPVSMVSTTRYFPMFSVLYSAAIISCCSDSAVRPKRVSPDC